MYMPVDSGHASYADYLNTLGELEGLLFLIVVMLTLLLVTSTSTLTGVVNLPHYCRTSWQSWTWLHLI